MSRGCIGDWGNLSEPGWIVSHPSVASFPKGRRHCLSKRFFLLILHNLSVPHAGEPSPVIRKAALGLPPPPQASKGFLAGRAAMVAVDGPILAHFRPRA